MIKRPILLLICFLALALNTSAETIREPFAEILPSQQTEQELQMLSNNTTDENTPQLRARPGDIWGSDQGQKVPIGDLGIKGFLLLSILLVSYGIISKKYRKKKWNTKLPLPIIFLIAGTASVNAQIQAVSDNYFLEPGVMRALDVTINDEPGDCADTRNLISLTIVTPPHSDIQYQVNGQTIRVRPSATARGQYTLKYRITCNSGTPTSSDATVYLNVGNHPDFMDDASCTVDRPSFKWDINRMAVSSEMVQSYAFPLIGDVDGDGKIEIVTSDYTASIGPSNSKKIFIFNSDLVLKKSIDLPCYMDTYVIQAMAIADVDPVKNDGPEILVASGLSYYDSSVADAYKMRLFCYSYNKATGQWYQKWRSPDVIYSAHIRDTWISNMANVGSSISVADVDGDGLVEILVGDRVFSGGDADGLNGGLLLATMPVGGRGVFVYTPNITAYMTCFADIDGDGQQEIVAGNTTYKMSLNHAVPSSSVIDKYYSTNQLDGVTSIADIDGDGVSDVIVVGRSGTTTPCPTHLYVWQGNSANLVGPVLNNTNANWPGGGTRLIGSRAFAGDIDGDGYADIAFTSDRRFDAIKYNRGTMKYESLFSTGTSDVSGATTMTMFDFDNDGKVELVYRDETHLRIIGKHPITGVWGDLVAWPLYSGTHTEYPVVADVDQDGHADIIVAGALTNTNVNASQRLNKFGSLTPKTWSPARGVWHQHGYNPLMINDNLSVPRYPINPASPVTRKDGSVHYPFNSFLQQVSLLNMEGDPLYLAPDLAFQSKSQQMSLDAAGNLTITGYIENIGNREFVGDILLSLYGYFDGTNQYQFIGNRAFPTQSLDVYDQASFQFTINGFTSLAIDPTRFYLALNLNDASGLAPTPYYKSQAECFSWNNMTSRLSYIGGHVVLCDGESATLHIEPANKYDCYWHTDAKAPYPTNTTNLGDSKAVTKGTSGTDEYYLINVHQKSSANAISSIPDTVFIYQSVDTLIWTGAVDSDWHNEKNWICPTDTKSETFRYIPRGCTNVLIPATKPNGSAITIYPDLNAASTQYAAYAEAMCNNISFEHGGEVVQIDLLSYKKAYIQVDLLSNRWYTFAPPLRSFYTGDVYQNNPNPFLDGLLPFTRMFSQPDPQHNSHVQGDWGRAFNTPTQTFSVGQGLGVWIDDFEKDESIKSTQSFSYPKHDLAYSLYNINPPHSVTSGPHAVADRTRSHRFIFEEKQNASTKDVQLQVEAVATGQRIMIANPYMAHLDFDEFYNYGNNANLIEPHYTIMEDGYSYASYYLNDPSASTGIPKLDKNIAPMQAIIVEAKVPINPAVNPLITNGTMTTTLPGITLRKTKDAEDGGYFKISISDTQKRSKVSLTLNGRANDNLQFDNTRDVLKTITKPSASVTEKIHPVIYFITEDSKYVDIKALSKAKELTLPIGLLLTDVGPMALGFENVEFFSGYYLYLFDKIENRQILITEDNPIYCFNNTNVRGFVNDRFAIRITTELSGIENETIEADLIFKTGENTISISSTDGSALEQVIVYDLQGKLVVNTRVSSDSYSVTLPKGIYIVRVKDTIRKAIL